MPNLDRTGLGAAALAFMAFASPSFAQDSAHTLSAFVEFGLPGIWATDCSMPPSRSNRRVYYEVLDDGSVVVRISYDGQTFAVESRLSQAEVVADDLIRYYQAYDDTFGMTVTLQHRADGRIQGVQATASDGTLLVKDGILLKENVRTGSDERCREPVPIS